MAAVEPADGGGGAGAGGAVARGLSQGASKAGPKYRYAFTKFGVCERQGMRRTMEDAAAAHVALGDTIRTYSVRQNQVAPGNGAGADGAGGAADAQKDHALDGHKSLIGMADGWDGGAAGADAGVVGGPPAGGGREARINSFRYATTKIRDAHSPDEAYPHDGNEVREVQVANNSAKGMIHGFFGIFDGHGGHQSADYCAMKLPQLLAGAPTASLDADPRGVLLGAFNACDQALRDSLKKNCSGYGTGLDSGCTAVCVVFSYDTLADRLRLHCANLGDSRCVLGRWDGGCVALSEDHSPSVPAERERIEKAGGHITKIGKTARVMGLLAVTRAFGDFCLKLPDVKKLEGMNKQPPITADLVSRVPDIVERACTDEDHFVILACDGIWNVFNNEDAVNFVRARLTSEEIPAQYIPEGHADEPTDAMWCKYAATELAEAAIDRGSKDNCSAMVVLLEVEKEKLAKAGALPCCVVS